MPSSVSPSRPSPGASMAPPPAARRRLAVWFPFLPTERVRRTQAARTVAPGEDAPGKGAQGLGPDPGSDPGLNSGGAGAAPFALAERAKNALRLAAVDARALALGLAPGMTLADARARAPDLEVAPADAGADARLLVRLGAFCDRFSPSVALDPPDALVMDVTGVAHLFGGEARLASAVVAALRARGFTARAVIASGADAALALARFERVRGAVGGAVVVAPEEEEARVRALPIRALRCAPDTLTGLARAGLTHVGLVADRPAQTLAARFGAAFVTMLEAALGRGEAPRAPLRAPPAHAVDRLFAEPLGHADGIAVALADLAADLCAALVAAGAGGRAFEASFFRTDGVVRRIAVETGRPMRDAAALLRLFRERMETLADPLDPGFGFDAMRLAAVHAEPLAAAQIDLSGRVGARADVADLADRLTARLGRSRVLRFIARDAHDPECAAAWRAAADGPPPGLRGAPGWTPADPGEPPLRPLQIFDPPQPMEALAEVPDGPPLRFRWRRRAHDVTRSEGPERIAPAWFRVAPDDPAPIERDYYRIEDGEGRRFWVMREGAYGAAEAPRWYVAGLFA